MWTSVAAVGDLDGDGRAEAYLSHTVGSSTLEVLRLEGGVFRTQAVDARSIHSAGQDARIAELDGVPPLELVVGTVAWNGYRLMVYRPGPGGSFIPVDALRLGQVRLIGARKCADGPGEEILVSVNHHRANSSYERLIGPHPENSLRVYRLEGGQLQEQAADRLNAAFQVLQLWHDSDYPVARALGADPRLALPITHLDGLDRSILRLTERGWLHLPFDPYRQGKASQILDLDGDGQGEIVTCKLVSRQLTRSSGRAALARRAATVRVGAALQDAGEILLLAGCSQAAMAYFRGLAADERLGNASPRASAALRVAEILAARGEHGQAAQTALEAGGRFGDRRVQAGLIALEQLGLDFQTQAAAALADELLASAPLTELERARVEEILQGLRAELEGERELMAPAAPADIEAAAISSALPLAGQGGTGELDLRSLNSAACDWFVELDYAGGAFALEVEVEARGLDWASGVGLGLWSAEVGRDEQSVRFDLSPGGQTSLFWPTMSYSCWVGTAPPSRPAGGQYPLPMGRPLRLLIRHSPAVERLRAEVRDGQDLLLREDWRIAQLPPGRYCVGLNNFAKYSGEQTPGRWESAVTLLSLRLSAQAPSRLVAADELPPALAALWRAWRRGHLEAAELELIVNAAREEGNVRPRLALLCSALKLAGDGDAAAGLAARIWEQDAAELRAFLARSADQLGARALSALARALPAEPQEDQALRGFRRLASATTHRERAQALLELDAPRAVLEEIREGKAAGEPSLDLVRLLVTALGPVALGGQSHAGHAIWKRQGGELLIELSASFTGPPGHYLRGLGLAYAGTLEAPRYDEAAEALLEAVDARPDAGLRDLIDQTLTSLLDLTGRHWDNDRPRGGVIHARCELVLAQYLERHDRAADAQKRRAEARRALAAAVYYGADAAALQQDPLLSPLFPLGDR